MNTTTPSNEVQEVLVKMKAQIDLLIQAADESVARDNQLQAEIDDLRQDREDNH